LNKEERYCIAGTLLSFYNEFSKYMKVERATSEYVFDYLFDVGYEKFLSEKEKR